MKTQANHILLGKSKVKKNFNRKLQLVQWCMSEESVAGTPVESWTIGWVGFHKSGTHRSKQV